jgi:hypothetical protein
MKRIVKMKRRQGAIVPFKLVAKNKKKPVKEERNTNFTHPHGLYSMLP